MRTRLTTIGLFVCLILALGPVAEAQLQPAGLALSASGDAADLEPGGQAEVQIDVANQGGVDGTVALSLEGGQDGWSAELSSAEVEVPAGSTETVTLTLTAPEDQATAADASLVTVSGTISDASGQFQDSDEVAVQATMAPPPPPAPEPFPWLLVITLTTGLVIATAAGAAWFVIRRRETGIELAAGPGARARPGDQAMVRVRVENTSDRPRLAEIIARDLPAGWIAASNLPQVPLSPGEHKELWMAVRLPSDAQEARESLEIAARPAEAKGFRATKRVEIDVVDRGAPEDAGGRQLLEQRPYSTHWDD